MIDDDGMVTGEAKFFIDGEPVPATGRIQIKRDPIEIPDDWDLLGATSSMSISGRWTSPATRITNQAEDSFVEKILYAHTPQANMGKGDPYSFHRPRIDFEISQRWPASPPMPPHDVGAIRWRDMPRHLWGIMRRSFAEAAGTARNERATAIIFAGLVLEPVKPRIVTDRYGDPYRPRFEPLRFVTRQA